MTREQTFTAGQKIRARYDYDYRTLRRGQIYEVVKFEPAHNEPYFRFPPYVIVRLANGKTYTSLTHHYEPVEN